MHRLPLSPLLRIIAQAEVGRLRGRPFLQVLSAADVVHAEESINCC